MTLEKAIHQRRSIRKYTDADVTDQQVETILSAAMMAPSAGNAQPWQFIVIRSKERLAQIKEINPYAGMAQQAPLAILVCGDLSLEKYAGFWVQDCSAAIQNLLLSVHALGLGAVWTGIYPIEERITGVRRLCNLPDHIVPLALIPVGHPAQSPRSSSRFRADRIHNETW